MHIWNFLLAKKNSIFLLKKKKSHVTMETFPTIHFENAPSIIWLSFKYLLSYLWLEHNFHFADTGYVHLRLQNGFGRHATASVLIFQMVSVGKKLSSLYKKKFRITLNLKSVFALPGDKHQISYVAKILLSSSPILSQRTVKKKS